MSHISQTAYDWSRADVQSRTQRGRGGPVHARRGALRPLSAPLGPHGPRWRGPAGREYRAVPCGPPCGRARVRMSVICNSREVNSQVINPPTGTTGTRRQKCEIGL